MRIRSPTPDDVSALVALNDALQSLHAEAVPELFRKSCPRSTIVEAFTRMLADPQALWFIAEETAPCGYIYAELREREESWFRPAHRICNISHLAVASQYRRKGVARSLVDAVHAQASARGYTRIELDVWSFNQGAKEAFQHLGFRTFNERMVWQKPNRATGGS